MNPKWIGLLALAPLVLLLLVAVRQDVQTHLIPNKVVFTGVILGITLNGFVTQGWGFNTSVPGGLGWFSAFNGLCVGIAVLLPLYWLRAMGAGDVKLMGMVGSFLGATDVLGVALATFIAGGLMALTMIMWSKQFFRMLGNIKLVLLGCLVKVSSGELPIMNDLPISVGQLPYALAISVGTISFLLWQRMY